jgi:trigger factor
MASVQQSNIGINHDKLSVSITTHDYLPKYEQSLKQYAKTANIPGFRKGMVPVGHIKRSMGNAILADEVMRVAAQEVDKYLTENKVKFFAQPLALKNDQSPQIDYNNPQDYTFDFEIGLHPQFNIPLLQGSQVLDAYKVIVTDEMVNEEVEQMQYRAGAMTEPETITEDKNVLNVTFTEVDANGTVITDGANGKNSMLLRYYNDKGKQQWMGKKVGDSITAKLIDVIDEKTLPAILKDLKLNPTDDTDKQKYFTIALEKLGHVEPAVLDAGLYDDVYKGQGIATEQEFRDKIRSEIQMYWDGQGRNKLHNDIFETLVHETPMDLPADFLKRWIASQDEGGKTEEEVSAEWGKYDHQLRWQLISDSIIAENNITVEQEEIDMGLRNKMLQYFQQMGMPVSSVEDEWLTNFVEKQKKDQKAVGEVYNQIITDKVFAVLEGKVAVNMKDVSLEEFAKAPSLHHHHH